MTFSDQVKQIEVQLIDMRDRPNRDHRMLNLCKLLFNLIIELHDKLPKTDERRSSMAGKTKPKAATGSGKAKAKATGGTKTPKKK